jgi:hypothetical protein
LERPCGTFDSRLPLAKLQSHGRKNLKISQAKTTSTTLKKMFPLKQGDLLQMVKDVHWDLGYCTGEDSYRAGLAYRIRKALGSEFLVYEEYPLKLCAGEVGKLPEPLYKPDFLIEEESSADEHYMRFRSDIVVFYTGIVIAVLELKFAQKLCYANASQAICYVRQCVRNGMPVSKDVVAFIIMFNKSGAGAEEVLLEDTVAAADVQIRLAEWCENDKVIEINNLSDIVTTAAEVKEFCQAATSAQRTPTSPPRKSHKSAYTSKGRWARNEEE